MLRVFSRLRKSSRKRSTSQAPVPPPLLRYEPLPHSRSIRVLHITELTPDSRHKLTVSFHVIELATTSSSDKTASPPHQPPTYDALSYTWGSPFSTPSLKVRYTSDFDVVIKVIAGGSTYETKITRNLYEGLEQLYNAGHREPLWVDALCINQQNLAEKSEQVRMMCDIYISAKTVIVWLGIDDPDFPTLDHVIELGTRMLGMQEWELRHGGRVILQVARQSDTTATHIEAIGTSLQAGSDITTDQYHVTMPVAPFNALYRFLARRRYISRAWTMQEIALSENFVVLMNGQMVGADRLVDIIDRVGSNAAFVPSFLHSEPEQETVGNGSELVETFHRAQYRAFYHEASQPEMQRLKDDIRALYRPYDDRTTYLCHLELYMTGEVPRHCQDPRDTIYSLLGVLDALFPNTPCPVAIDYTASWQDVYIGFTTMLLTALPHRTVLSAVEHLSSSRSHDLPSWVPDYLHRSRKRVPIASRQRVTNVHNYLERSSFVLGPALPQFTAGFDDTAQPSLWIADKRLMTHARHCGKVTAVHRHCSRTSSQRSPQEDGESLLRDHNLVLGMLFKEGKDIAQVQRWFTSFFQVCSSPSSLMGWADEQTFQLRIRAHLMSRLLLVYRRMAREQDVGVVNSLRADLTAFLHHARKLQGAPCIPTTAFLHHIESMADPYVLPQAESDFLASITKRTDTFYLFDVDATFLTDNGLLGQGQSSMQAGDELWLICGARVPFILRPQADGTYTLLCEALVDGIMHGELIKDGRAGEPEVITIV